MEQKTDRIYTTAPLENINFEQILKKKINIGNSFKNHKNNIKEMITYFRDKIYKSKKKFKNYKTLNTILKPFDTFVFFATTSSSIILSPTGSGLIAIPISSSVVCGLAINNKVIFEIIMQKYNKYKKQFEKDQQTIESFDKLYKKSLQDNVIDKNE